MAISVDYTTTPFTIEIPQSDLTLISGTQYELNVDTFWNLLRSYSDSEEGVVQPVTYSRVAADPSGTPSITNVNDDYYQLQFEDGLYSVNVVGGNTNIRTVEVKNQVSVNTNNTAGLFSIGSGLSGAQDTKLTRIHALLDVIEGSLDHAEVMRILLAAAAGKLSGADGTSVLIRDLADSKNRIDATVDENGNRSAVTLDAS